MKRLLWILATGQGIQSAVRGMSAGLTQYRVSGDAADLSMPDHADDEDSQKLKGDTDARGD
jgi:hypothetical protein